MTDRLRGVADLEVRADFELKAVTTLRVGGPADLWVCVRTESALRSFLEAAHEAELAFQVVGQGANLLIPDSGLRGAVCQLRGELQSCDIDGTRVIAGGGMLLARLALLTLRKDLLGLEALAGFPSTVGGAVVMNAGCYGVEIKDLVIEVQGLDRRGARFSMGVSELGAGYRHTVLRELGGVVTQAEFQLRPGDGAAGQKRMRELNKRRWGSLPSGKPNAGSIFKNPPGDHAGRLIEACGLKGHQHGGAVISERHANVIVNQTDARAQDVLELMIAAHRAVKQRFGIDLEPELVLAGELAERWRRETSP